MEQILCKICGQPLVEVREGFYKCSSCLSEFKKEATVSAEQKQLEEAYELIRKGNFSDAEALCTTLLKAKDTSYEAYWVRALAKNGVIFVRDIGDRMVPTCQNIVEEQFLADADVQKAIELAPTEIAENYRSQGERIESIRKEWFEIASKEAPYDVFICFKDSDKENGIDRTRDSEYAQDLYNYLGTKGLNVFFSRVSLMGKVSEHYEPYIYNALKTAKVMIVYGEKAEYFNSTWLRNEWSRFIARMQRENMPKDSLIVAYRGVDPYRIPSALLGGRQGLDLTKPSAFNILVEKVVDAVAKAKKVITLERKEIKGGQMSKKASTISLNSVQTREIGASATAQTNITENQSIKLIQVYLEEQQWVDALSLANDVLQNNPTSPKALWCKILASYHEANGYALLHKLDNFKTKDYETIDKILNHAEADFAQDVLLCLYKSEQYVSDSTYKKVLEIILPFSFAERERKIAQAFEGTINRSKYDSFQLLLNTLSSTDVDRYIEYNCRYANKTSDVWEKEQCLRNIFTVDEGNLEALRTIVRLDLSAAKSVAQTIRDFEKLLQYCPDIEQEVLHNIEWLSKNLSTTEHCEIAEQLLKYYGNDLSSIVDQLVKLSYKILEEGLFGNSEYFLNLILSMDPDNADAYWGICLMKIQARTERNILEKDSLLKDVPEFNKYLTLVGEGRQRECIRLSREQVAVRERREAKHQADIDLLSARKEKNSIAQRRKNELLSRKKQLQKEVDKKNIFIYVLLFLFTGWIGIIIIVIMENNKKKKRKELDQIEFELKQIQDMLE